MIYQFISDHSSEFSVQKMCIVLKVTRSGYYHWIHNKQSQHVLENEMLWAKIKRIYDHHKGRYGSVRITEELHDLGYTCSRARVARIMQKHGLKAKSKRKFKVTTQSDHKHPIAPNLLRGGFFTSAVNLVWLSDITYIRTVKGWLYLTIIMDLYSRRIIGWSMSDRLTADRTTIPALMMAYRSCQPLPGTIFHSDRGIQYACEDFVELLDSLGMIQSMSGVGNCYDNAVAESFFHTLKTELVHHEKYKSRIDARSSLFEYIEIYYNRERKHSSLGYKSPEQFEKLMFKNVV